MSNANKTEACKQVAIQFLQQAVIGRIDEAYQKYVDLQGKHHNPFFPTDFPELRKAMIENHMQFPSKQLTIKNVLGDGDRWPYTLNRRLLLYVAYVFILFEPRHFKM